MIRKDKSLNYSPLLDGGGSNLAIRF